MYYTINGWTREKIISQIYNVNNHTENLVEQRHSDKDAYHKHIKRCFFPEEHPARDSVQTIQDALQAYPELQSKIPLSVEGMRSLVSEYDAFAPTSPTSDMREHLTHWVLENVDDSVGHGCS